MIPAGQAIGNYRILSKIGTGGMGVVYLAEHPLIGKRVALKVIHRDLATQREVVQRFFQEAWAVNKIGDEHIVEIHDFGQTPEGDHFYIMEFLEGETLATAISRRPLDVIRALHIGAQIASALAAAHGAGVMHRDLKPDNIMLTTRLGDPDFVKLLDFGLAKIFIGAEASTVTTAAGILLGTPQYMSPEACETRGDVDHRTDIYALGVLLFQMLTGVVPFDGESVGEVLVKQVTQLPPPLRSFNPSIPPSVEQIALRCLMKAPDKRFSTMLELRAALLDPEAYLRSGPPAVQARALRPGEAASEAKTIVAPAASDAGPPSATAPTRHGDLGVGGAGLGATAAPNPAPLTTMAIPTPVGYISHSSSWGWGAVLFALLVIAGGGFAAARILRKDKSMATDGLALASNATFNGVVGSATHPTDHASAPKEVPLGGSSEAPQASDAAVADAGRPAADAANTDAGIPGDSGEALPADAAIVALHGSEGTGASSGGQAESPQGIVLIDSVPRGADIIGPNRTVFGKTPAKLRLPVAEDTVTVNLRLRGYQTKTKQFVVTGNAVIAVPLDKVRVAKRRDRRDPVGNRTSRAKERLPRRSADDLERP